MSGSSEEDGDKMTFEDHDREGYNRFGIGANIGAGAGKKMANGGMLFPDLRYMLSLTSLSDEDEITYPNQGMIISLGYLANLSD